MLVSSTLWPADTGRHSCTSLDDVHGQATAWWQQSSDGPISGDSTPRNCFMILPRWWLSQLDKQHLATQNAKVSLAWLTGVLGSRRDEGELEPRTLGPMTAPKSCDLCCDGFLVVGFRKGETGGWRSWCFFGKTWTARDRSSVVEEPWALLVPFVGSVKFHWDCWWSHLTQDTHSCWVQAI